MRGKTAVELNDVLEFFELGDSSRNCHFTLLLRIDKSRRSTVFLEARIGRTPHDDEFSATIRQLQIRRLHL